MRTLFSCAALLVASACQRRPAPLSDAASSASALASVPRAPSAPPSAKSAAPTWVTNVHSLRDAKGGEAYWLHLERRGDEVRGHLVEVERAEALAFKGVLRDGRALSMREVSRHPRPTFLEGEFEGGQAKALRLQGGGRDARTLEAAAPKPLTDWPGGEAAGFEGTIGELAIVGQLDRKGERLEGFYQYRRSVDDLKLLGSVDRSTGRFELVESAPGGAVGASWQGTYLGAWHWAGTWRSADGARSLPVWLEVSARPDPVLSLPGGGKLAQRAERTRLPPRCQHEVRYPELIDLPDRGAQRRLNDELRKHPRPLSELTEECSDRDENMPFRVYEGYDLISTKRPGFIALTFNVGSHSHARMSEEPDLADCVVLDLRAGRVRRLRELLSPGAEARLTAAATAKLRRSGRTNDLKRLGACTPALKVPAEPNLCLFDGDVVFNVSDQRCSVEDNEDLWARFSFREMRAFMTSDPLAEALLR